MRLPAHERGPADLRKRVDAALDPDEPAIDVAEQDFRRIGGARLRSRGRPGYGQGRRTDQRCWR